MDELSVPIFRKAYDLYKALHLRRNNVPKNDRHTLWQRIETRGLALIEQLFLAGNQRGSAKQAPLEQANLTLNVLRLLVRLAKDTRTIDVKIYAELEVLIDEIGRMLGGWIKASVARPCEKPTQ